MGAVARKGEARFDAVMREHLPAVSAYARSVTSRSAAEEAVQETFIRAWRYWPTFRNESSELSWLIAICRNVVVDLARKGRPTEELPANVVDMRDDYARTELNDLIAGLPLPQREVVVLCAVLGFDYETTALTLGVPVGTVRSRLARARESLGRQIDIADAM